MASPTVEPYKQIDLPLFSFPFRYPPFVTFVYKGHIFQMSKRSFIYCKTFLLPMPFIIMGTRHSLGSKVLVPESHLRVHDESLRIIFISGISNVRAEFKYYRSMNRTHDDKSDTMRKTPVYL